MSEALILTFAVVSFIVVALGLGQYVSSFWIGMKQTPKARSRDAKLESQTPDPADKFTMYFLVPCLNEEAVIGATITAALAQHANANIIVIDDDSEDDTVQIASSFDSNRVSVVERTLPEARLGKGKALNAAYKQVLQKVKDEQLDPTHVVICVMDADGQLSEGAVGKVLRLFDSERVGGVQLPVRIRNTGTLITDYQDLEFWGVSAVPQIGRSRVGTVSLGGNGQFTRLSALLGLEREPWTESLTEDLDLAISLAANGWWLDSTPDAWVSQQAVTSVKALVRQRTRWMQGHMTCAFRLRELWNSPWLSSLALAEMTTYLLAPITLILPWSILLHIGLYFAVTIFMGSPVFEIADSALITKLVLAFGMYALSFTPAYINGWMYHRRSGRGLIKSIALAHTFVFFNYVTFLATWKAAFRMLIGRKGWAKTRRAVEPIGAT